MTIQIHRNRTAITRTTFSKPYRLLIEKKEIRPNMSVLDYGCGKGFDVQRLQNFPGSVDVSLTRLNIRGYDPFQPGFNCPEFLEMDYDVVTCNYVMNVIESPQERAAVVRRLLALAPVVFLSVRADRKAVKDSWKPFADGWLTPNSTFQKLYDREEATREFPGATVVHEDSSFIMLKFERI